MTKKNAVAITHSLDCRCDEPYMFAVKVGAGCLVSVKNRGDGWILLTLFINLLENVMQNLRANHHDDFRNLLCHALKSYIEDTAPVERKEKLSDKQRAKRIKANEQTLAELEAVL